MGKLKKRTSAKPKLTADQLIEAMLCGPDLETLIRDPESLRVEYPDEVSFFEAAKTASEPEIRAMWGNRPNCNRGLIGEALKDSGRAWLLERLQIESKGQP